MNKSEYAYAVGRIRANENNLLSFADYNQLISAQDVTGVIRLLNDKGWCLGENAAPGDTEKELIHTWKLITESVPDAALLSSLIIENDFNNLKAAIKAVFSDIEPEQYYSYPCITDTKTITSAVKNHDFRELPDYLSGCADEAYSALIQGATGQQAEFIIDRCSLLKRKELAALAESDMLKQIAALKTASANIKIAIRCAMNGKSPEFAASAMIPCDEFDTQELADNAGSFEKIAEFIDNTVFSFLSPAIKEGFSQLEKCVDDRIITLLQRSKYDAFGPDPIISYWFTKVYEIRNARIILSAKANSLPAEEIKKRVRGVYV